MDGPSWGGFTTGGAWLSTHIWEHYLFTRDRAFLQEFYPVLKGAAEFFLDTLVPHPTRGWLVTNLSTSPESFPLAPGNVPYCVERQVQFLPRRCQPSCRVRQAAERRSSGRRHTRYDVETWLSTHQNTETQVRKLTLIEHISLDGVIQVSGEDGSFPYHDWTARYRTPAGRDAVLAAHGDRFDLLLGRRTYDLWSGFWPKAPSSPIADALNAATKYVATHRAESLEWGPFEGLGPDILEGIRHIKSQEGPDLVLSGSCTLTSTLLEHGLADEVVLIVYPVLLGAGKRFFAEGTPARSLELVGTQAMPSGVILSTYRVAGPLKVG
jgi:dihydrofolate reductase